MWATTGGSCGAARPRAAPELEPGTAVHRAGILMPGLISAHCHTPMVLLRGRGRRGCPWTGGCTEVMWPRESKLSGDDVRAGMRLGAAELLTNGITASMEMYFHGQTLAEGATDAGLRCLVTPGVIEDPDFGGAGPWPDQLDEMVALRDRWATSDLIDVGFGAHAAYSVSTECLSAIASYAADTGMPVHIHLAEQQWEDAAVRERSGGLGGARVPGVAGAAGRRRHRGARRVADRRRHRGAGPQRHRGGALPVLQRQARLRGGSGGGDAGGRAASGHRHRRAGVAPSPRPVRGDAHRHPDSPHPLRRRPDAPTGRGAADDHCGCGRGAGLGHRTRGGWRRGCWADMTALSAAEPALNPVITGEDDPLSRIVWSGSPGAISGVWVAGRKVVEDGRVLTLDMAEAVTEAETRARRLAQ